MGATTPDNILFPDGSYTGGFKAIMAAMAGSIQDALNMRAVRSFTFANLTAQNNETRMVPGSEGYRVDLDAFVVYTAAGQWRRRYTSGLVPLRPTLVVASTGTVTQSGNKVTVNQVPSNLRLDGVFSSDFQNYRIFVDIEAVGTSTQFGMQFATAGTVDGTAIYDFARLYNSGTTPTATSTAATPVTAFTPTALGGTRINSVIEVGMLPGSRKAVSAQSECSIAAGTPVAITMAGQYRNTAAVDGLNISPNANVTTAGAQLSVAVFGYNNGA